MSAPADLDAEPQGSVHHRGDVALFLGLVAIGIAGNCSIRRSVRFAPAKGLGVLKAIDKTRFPRLPWSFDPVPHLYELTTADYRTSSKRRKTRTAESHPSSSKAPRQETRMCSSRATGL